MSGDSGRILALETSCDDTCAAILDARGALLANVISSQGVHDRFGGVVPEIASRHHLELVNLVIEQALEAAEVTLADIDVFAATRGPGLVGALLVGLSTAKALAAARELPFAPVDHLQGHVAANFLAAQRGRRGRDVRAAVRLPDRQRRAHAAGACHRARRLSGAGAHARRRRRRGLRQGRADARARLSRGRRAGAARRGGDPQAYTFPGSAAERARGGKGAGRQAFERSLDFSFAGLKTALLYRLRELPAAEIGERAADLAASYQAAIVDSLLARAEQALDAAGLDRLAVGGGVAANGELRRRLRALGATVHVPARVLCTDNAAMIASAARYAPQLPYPAYLGLDAYATGEQPL